MPLASLLPDKPLDFDNATDENCRDYDRALLGSALGQQVQNGPVERQYLETTTSPAFKHEGKIRKAGITKLTPGICGRAIAMEWHLMPKLKLEPGMSQAEIARVCTPERIDEIRHARNIITLWSGLRQFLNRPERKVSGRLMLKQTNGQRAVQWRGVARYRSKQRCRRCCSTRRCPTLDPASVSSASRGRARSQGRDAAARADQASARCADQLQQAR